MCFEKMWSFETGKYRVEWAICPDDDTDMSWDESGEVRENLESGLWMCFVSRVRVTHKRTGAVLGESFLGGSIYENPEGFRDHFGIRNTRYGSYFSDMVREAVMEARQTIAKGF